MLNETLDQKQPSRSYDNDTSGSWVLVTGDTNGREDVSMNSKVVHIDDVGDIIQDTVRKYEGGEIKNIMVRVIDKEGITWSAWSDAGMGFIETLGHAEDFKLTIHEHGKGRLD